MPPRFVACSVREHMEDKPVHQRHVERHEHGCEHHVAQEMSAFAHADEAGDAAERDGGGHQLGASAAREHGNGKAEREGRRGLAADEGAVPLAGAGALEHRRETVGTAELDDMDRPRPRPIVLEHGIGDEARPGDEHEREEDPFGQAEAEEMPPPGKSEDDAGHRGDGRAPGQGAEAPAKDRGERRMVEEKMTRLDIEETRSGEVDVRPADEDDRRGDADQRGNPGELERGLGHLASSPS